MNSKEQYYRDHPCPYWADEEQWAKLLNKIIFTPDGGISFKGLSVNEVKILDGFSFSAVLEQRTINKSEREALLRLKKFVGRDGALSEGTKALEKINAQHPNLSSKEIRKIAEKENPDLFKEMPNSTFTSKISRIRSK
jgi:hypothetical protein